MLAVLILNVDFRSRRLRFPRACRGASSAHLRLRGLPCPVLPQDFEFASSNPPTHEGNAIAFPRSLRRLPLQSTCKESPITFNTAYKINRTQFNRTRLK